MVKKSDQKAQLIRKNIEYKGCSIRITQLKNGHWKAVAGGVFVVAETEFEARLHIRAQIDQGW